MIILFDVDGVLVHNLAYRVALRQTVAYFSERLGLGDLPLTEADIDVFESQSITVEWDSAAICVAALLVERLRRAPVDDLPADLWAGLDFLGARPAAIRPPDFGALARLVGQASTATRLPGQVALSHFLDGASGGVQNAAPLVRQLLGDTYDVEQAPAKQIFQNYALGHEAYAQYYGLPARIECEALLEKLDQPALRADVRDQLLARQARGEVFGVIYTARPSLAPTECVDPPRGYTPEAEIARRLVGLDALPVMGFGKVDWWARRVGLLGSDLVKPSPVQCMAALGAARTGLEIESLKAALAAARGDHLRYPLTACRGETVHVFEDSASSLQAVTQAIQLLNRHGLELKLVRHGVAPPGSAKWETLPRVADLVHADLSDGLAQVLSTGARVPGSRGA